MNPLQQGSTGADVGKLQTALNTAGYNVGNVDNNFGPKTAAGLAAYQTANGLKADSVFGPITSGKLYGGEGGFNGPASGPKRPLSDFYASSNGKSPLELTQSLDVPAYGSDVKDANGKVVGKAQFDPNTGQPLKDPNAPVVGTSDAARTAALEKIKGDMTSGLGNEPTPYKSLDEFNRLRTEKGVVQDESELNTVKNEQAKIQQSLREFKATAGEGTSEAGRIGAVSEAERNAQFRLDSLNIQETAVTNRLATKNAYISTVLNLGKEDYNTAYTRYTNEYNKNIKAIDLYNTQLNTSQKDALTGFTTITNLLKDHDVSKLDTTTMHTLDSLALQAGLPKGIFQAVIQATPNEKILSPVMVTNADGSKDAYFYTQAKDGTPSLKTVQHLNADGSPSNPTNPKKPESKMTTKTATPAISSTLKTGVAPGGEKIGNPVGADGFSDPGVYVEAYKNWPGTAKQFLNAFPVKTHVNPASYNLLPEAIRPAAKAGAKRKS